MLIPPSSVRSVLWCFLLFLLRGIIRFELPLSLSFSVPFELYSFYFSFEFGLDYFLGLFLVGVELLLFRLAFFGGFMILLILGKVSVKLSPD